MVYIEKCMHSNVKCRHYLHSFLDISPVYLTRGISCKGAFAILKSVDFRAFAVNVKTIARGRYLYQSGHAIWWSQAALPVDTFIEANDFTGKTVIPFCTSASSRLGESGELLAEMAGAGEWLEGMRFQSSVSEEDIITWVENLGLN